MRILALIPGGIDNQILFFPTLASLRSQYPDATIDVSIEPRAKSAYRVCPDINRIFAFDYRDRNGLADYLNLLGMIREQEYDVALSLTQRWSIDFLLWLDGIPTRIGYQTKSNLFLTRAIPWRPQQYIADSYHDLTQGLGPQRPRPPLTIRIPDADLDWVKTQQAKLGLSPQGYVLIHDLPMDNGRECSYPVPQWQGIIEDIQRRFPDWSIVLIRGQVNAAWVTKMQTACPQTQILSVSDVGKLAALIAGAKYLLCSDSTPMHLSVAVGTQTVALFGPSKANQQLPANDERFLGIQSLTSKIADIAPSTIFQQLDKN